MTRRFPMPSFPVGWFQVAYSQDIVVGDVIPLHYFGQHLVLFRGEDEKLGLLHAYCPHLGAHLGHGGKVKGNSVVCPFHAWQFDCTGKCTEVPYADRHPKRADTKAWHVVERSGLILAWYHPDDEPPSWDPPEAPEYGDPEWTDYTRKDWKIRSHNQEMTENAVDSAHFHYLHGTQNIPATEAERNGHILHMKSPATMTYKGMPVEGKILSDLYGFGYTQTRFFGIAETCLVSSATPIDGEHVHVRFNFMLRKTLAGSLIEDPAMLEMVSSKFRSAVIRELELDIPIWEYKIYVAPPVLCDGDGPIGIFRKWVKQFYTQSQYDRSEQGLDA